MVTNWIPLFIGLFFGLIPPRQLMKGEMRYLVFEDLWLKAIRPPEGSQRRRRWWKLPLVWIDPIRGFVTAQFVLQAFKLKPGVSGLVGHLPLFLTTVALLLCLWIQTLGRQKLNETISPMGFLAGMLAAILPYEVSIPVLILGAASVVAVRDYAFGYAATLVICIGFGYFFMGVNLKLITPVLLIIMPVIVNWLRGTQLVVPVRC